MRSLQLALSLVFVVASLVSTGCQTTQAASAAETVATTWRRPAPATNGVVVQSIDFRSGQLVGADYAFVDGHTGELLTFDQVLVRLRAAQAVIVGEQHDQPAHHELQRRVVAALAADGKRLVVGLEMLEWSHQASLDAFNAGTLDADGLARAVDWPKAWGFPFGLYQPIFVDGHRLGATFVALNAPRSLVKRMRQVGVDGLSAEERQQVPQLDLGDDAHRAWFQALMAGGGHPMSQQNLEGFYRAQVLWDEVMAEHAVRALSAHDASQVVVLCGAGHVARGHGVPQRIERRLGGAAAKVVSLVPLADVSMENSAEVLTDAVNNQEGDILVVARFEESLSL